MFTVVWHEHRVRKSIYYVNISGYSYLDHLISTIYIFKTISYMPHQMLFWSLQNVSDIYGKCPVISAYNFAFVRNQCSPIQS